MKLFQDKYYTNLIFFNTEVLSYRPTSFRIEPFYKTIISFDLEVTKTLIIL